MVLAFMGIFFIVDMLTRSRFPPGKSIYNIPLITLFTFGIARVETRNVVGSTSLCEFYAPPKFSRYIHACVHLLTISYTLVASNALEPLNCQEQNGIYIMVSNPSTQCYSTEWKNYVPHMIAAIVFYMIGIPLLCATIFFRHRKNVRDVDFLFKYGCLTSGYRDSYPWWEIVNLFRKGVLTMVIYIISNADYLRIFILIAVFLIIMFLQVTFNPYAFTLNNSLAFGWMLSALVCLFSGLVFSNTITSVDSLVFTALILLFLIGNVVFTLYATIKEVFFSLQIKAEEKRCAMSYFLIEDKQHSAVKTYLRSSGEQVWYFLSGQSSTQRRNFFDDMAKVSHVQFGVPQQSEKAQSTPAPGTTSRGKKSRVKVESTPLSVASLPITELQPPRPSHSENSSHGTSPSAPQE
jgi:hypothetical protein